MSVRKREWTTPKGVERFAWVVDYVDTTGKRRMRTFRLKKEADQFAATATVEVREGVHVADTASVTVETAGKLWLKSAERRVEHGTLVQYRQHMNLHIVPAIGQVLLSRLTVPAVREFEETMREAGKSPAMVRKVLVSLGSILADAQERGLVVRNAIREKSRTRQKGRDMRLEKRHRGKLKVGVDIPTREEVKALVAVLEGRWRPLLLTAIFAGLRASELRGLRWSDVDFARQLIHVRQRADFTNEIGRPKSEAGERSVPVPPMVINTLKEWKLACPKGDADLVLPNGSGNVESHTNIVRRGLQPAMIAAGVTIATDELDDQGKPVLAAKYTGLHSLRHFYASWLINRREDGGLGLPPKSVQERLGHATISLTLDTYSHLFPSMDDASELALAEAALLS
ncbi:tyrosine-type recombinase/integrase [Rhizobium sp. 32-5/1]|uniref:tyrosine-type recombinase/integrase n=1 Tax=Rhizobium sp. 32-5/1 TaxID=3019602 RepID=UPI00240DD2CF|nr:site-specific integrase [Rhizobium sp. 32-5/1]WEZ83537.1 tyrosine-type recombinase/integrase [Rhizobium sp. 32-5/1]